MIIAIEEHIFALKALLEKESESKHMALEQTIFLYSALCRQECTVKADKGQFSVWLTFFFSRECRVD